CLKFLGKEEEDIVHEQSLLVLKEIGVKVHSESVLKMLSKAGAYVDEKKMVVKISEDIVMNAISKAPKHFSLCAREPKNDVVLPSIKYPYICTNGLSVYMTDLETGKKRPTTRKDLADFAKLADSLEVVSYFWPEVTAGDVPEEAHNLHELWVSLLACSKHVQGDSVNGEDAKRQIALASLIAGSDEELRKRPIFSCTCCPIAPLSFEKGAVEAQVEFAKAGVPVSSMSMSMSGMSSPVTVAGTIVNANVENLASIVITQTANPGAPHVYASESTPIDMNTGGINYAANESPIISAGLAQMAKRYSLPCMVGQWGVDGAEPGMLKSFNELATISLTMISGTDCCSGMGGLNSALGASLEQMVIDAYLWEGFRPVMRNMSVTKETIALDVMKAVGHGGSFLTQPHTAKHFKDELYFPDKSKLAWEATLSKKMVANAKKVVKKALKEHVVPPVDKDIMRQGGILIKDFAKTLRR
ncbi:MAG TPA: trimethylamine methyltransferase family protein, partial [Thermoplasmata archaeon]|nr:trimethylamine methyltransferase family protein [Thermoplasmata archaeon]